jgi:hypothetical protein
VAGSRWLGKLGGNADVYENKGIAEKATQKLLKQKGLKIDQGRVSVQRDL